MRTKKKAQRVMVPDPVYSNIMVAKFINYLMKKGKKELARKIIYQTFDIIKEKTKKDPLEVFQKAIENVKPILEARPRRIGGATYQVPKEVPMERGLFLAMNWILETARKKKGKAMKEKLAEEIILASQNEGSAVKKKEDTHKMAEANKAFAHFAW